MSAKIAMLAVVAASAVSSVAANGPPPAFARASQLSLAFGNDENDVQGDTEADAYGPNDIAIANAEGIATFVDVTAAQNPFFDDSYAGDFAAAVTQADTFADNSDAISLTQSVADSDGASGAEAEAYAISTESGAGIGDAIAEADALAIGNGFGGADTLAIALGADDAAAIAISEAEVSNDEEDDGTLARAYSEADAIALNGDAYADAVSISVSGDDEFLDTFAISGSLAYADAQRGGDATAFAFSESDNDDDAEANAVSEAKSEADDFNSAGTAINQATSIAKGKSVGPLPDGFVGARLLDIRNGK